MEKYDIAAVLEHYHNYLNASGTGDALDDIGLADFEVINLRRFTDKDNVSQDYIKAVAVRDIKTNDIYVHYFGTGDGNWQYNAAAYGAEPQPSEMQEWALDFFDVTVADKYEGKSMGNLYVSGHSQGGNNAQFVTIRSHYGDYITQCISLDGPGFSYRFIDDSKEMFGEAIYERQRDKIYAYNGENDYVSILGQESIVKDGHTKYVKFTKEGMDFTNFHAIEGMLDDSVPPRIIILEGEENTDTPFRQYLANALEKVKNMPPEKQARAAELLMMLCEDVVGISEPKKSDMTSREFNELKEILAPFIVEILADKPEQLTEVLEQFGLDQAVVESTVDLVEHFNSFSQSEREIVISSLLSVLDYENNMITLNKSKIPKALLDSLPVILETALTHPEDIDAVLRETGVYKMAAEYIKEHPFQFVGICFGVAVFSNMLLPVVNAFIITEVIADMGIRLVQAMEWVGTKIGNALAKTFTALKNVITSIQKWYRNNFDAGVKYVRDNPYFKVDTEKLRSYASRISSVNSRLRRLDGELRSLYWQVGLNDLWDIIIANAMTSESPTLNKVTTYLNNTANNFENAENQAYQYIGG